MKIQTKAIHVAAFMLIVSNVSATIINVPNSAKPNTPQHYHVVSVFTANENLIFQTGQQSFVFITDQFVDYSTGANSNASLPCASFPSLTQNNWFAIPKKDPNNTANDNPAYRDMVNIATMAYLLNKEILVDISGCVGGAQSGGMPQVVGVQIAP